MATSADRGREYLLKKARYGYWAAFAGLVVQLLGVIWDALLHHADPDLSARESVFSLTNPSHLLIVSGIGLAVVGVVWGIFFVSGGRSGFRLLGGSTLAIATLVALTVGTGATALATGGLSGSHEHHSDTANGPVLAELKGVLIAGGTETAMDHLEELAAEDEDVERRAHEYVHQLGEFSYSRYGDADEAFRLCGKGFDSGCYHGVVLGYFKNDPDFEADDVAPFCEGGAINADVTEILKFQCVHGLGHGLTAFFDQNLPEALSYCDFLDASSDRHHCYGGVFMEDIVSRGDSHERQGGSSLVGFLTREDLRYPCNELEDRYRWDCHAYQPLAVLSQNGHDFDEAFEECDKVPKPYVAACYEGMGGSISDFTVWDPDGSRDLCMLGTVSYRNHCFEGVVRNVVGIFRTTDEAVEFCSSVPAKAKRRCFELIGGIVPDLHTDMASRYEECEKAEEESWVAACRRSAGLGSAAKDEAL